MSERIGRQEQKGATFAALHEGEPFVIPNPWDAGSAKVLEALGFLALATTSSGFSFTLGRPDGGATLEELSDHVRALDQVTSLPISVDLENGHGSGSEAPAVAIERAAEAGAVGGSIEDWDPDAGLYPLVLAAERIAKAADAARRLDFPFMLTARAENHIRGNPDLDDTIARLKAYEQAGANVLYAPGLRSASEIRDIRAETSKPLNVLARPKLTVQEIFTAGAQRISLGGALTWTAVEAMAAAAQQIRDRGQFSALASGAPVREWIS